MARIGSKLDSRGMQESGARRIRRHVLIDTTSIKFCDDEMLNRFSSYEFVADYIRSKQSELEAYNQQHGINPQVMINGRRQTNIGIFRAYLTQYLKNNQDLRQDMTVMVRQLQPTESGLPLEIYVFSKEQSWEPMENIQSDIFDHILAGISYFDLRLFQNPSGADFQSLSSSVDR